MGRRRPGAGSVELRGNSFELRYFREDGKRTRKVLGRADEIDEAEALRRADDLLFALRGTDGPAPALTVAALVDSLDPVLRSFLAPATVRNVLASCGIAARFFGIRPARAVDVPAAQDFVASLAGRKGATVRKYRADLLCLWKLGHERGLLGPQNPWRHVRCPRAAEPAIRPLQRAAAERLAPFLPEDVADLLRLLCDTGMRCGEAARLRWEDVRDGRVHVRESKNGHPRSVPVISSARPVLAALRMRFGRSGSVLGGMLDGAGYDRVRFALVRACESADLPRMTLHGCRHGFACDLAEAGCTERDIARLLGHRHHKTTERYTRDLHPDASGDRAIARLEAHRASPARKAE